MSPLHTLSFEALPDAAPVGGGGEPLAPAAPEAVPGPVAELIDQTFGGEQQPQAPQEPDLAQQFAEQQQVIGEMYDYLLTMQERFQAPPPAPEAPPAAPIWNPLEPESVGNYLNHTFGKMLDERFAPLMPLMESFAESQGEAVAQQHFDRLEPQIGAFDREAALDRALYLIEVVGLEGPQAIEYAAKEVRARDMKIAQAAVAAYEQRLKDPLAAAGEPAAGGASGETSDPLPRGKSAYREQARRSLAARRLHAVQ